MTVKFPELKSIAAWIACDERRRRDVAEQVGREHGLDLEALAPFGRPDLPLASYRALEGLFRLVLVPGGELEIGFGDRELATLRGAAEQRRAVGEVDRGWLAWLEAASSGGDRARLVRPLLVAQNAIGGFAVERWREEIGDLFLGEGGDARALPESLDDGLAVFGYRVPWEHEWEWMARGGRTGELSYLGSSVPGEVELHALRAAAVRSEGPDDGDRHASIANDFGLLGFGVEAELCRDAYVHPPAPTPSFTAAIEDRVVKGGAGASYPWQNAGEWQGLLTAHRMRCGGLSYAIGVRLVREVD
jgi:hypothetical protein